MKNCGRIEKYGVRLFCTFLLLALFLAGTARIAVHVSASETESQAQTETVTYKNRLVKLDGKYYYYDKKGKMVKNCWKTISGKKYHFGKTGAADTGVVKISGKRYVFKTNGRLVTNAFLTVSGKTYYANSKGVAVTGFKTIKKKKYCFTSKGVMRTGWYTSGKKTYYFALSTGVMYTGWKRIDNKVYYFNKSTGVLSKDTWIGKYYVDKNGVYDRTKTSSIGGLRTKLKSAMSSYSGTWSIYVKNLSTGESLSINNQSMYAASLIKLYAMGACYQKISAGKIKESSVSSTLSDMITWSSNDAFNTIVKKIGTSYVNTWCSANGYSQTNQGHGLSPAANNSGLSNGSGRNLTSVEDCGKFLESVYNGTCVNAKYSKKMLALLKKQTRRSKIPAGVPSGVTVANKTGETDDYTHDAAIVYSKGATYIICVMAYVPGRAWGVTSNITKLSKITYNYFND